MKSIVILDEGTTNHGDLSWEELYKLGNVTSYKRTAPEQAVERCRGANIVLTNKVCLDKEMLKQLPNLEYIGILATGYNVVDIAEARSRGIVVTNIPAYSTDSVAQMVFAHILYITNNVGHYADACRKGAWTDCGDFCFWDTKLVELSGKCMAIVGLGNIGMRVASIANSFGMTVSALTSKEKEKLPAFVRKAASLEELLSDADVVSLHCPLTENTRHLINASTLRLMKPSAILINTGRGPLVDDAALADALAARRLAAYGADVMNVEPPSADNPLLSLPNAFFTPHIAWATTEARERLRNIQIANLKAFLAGKPINVVD